MTRLKLHAKRELSYDPQTSGIVWTLCFAHVDASRIAAFKPEGVTCKKCLAQIASDEQCARDSAQLRAQIARRDSEERLIKRLDGRA